MNANYALYTMLSLDILTINNEMPIPADAVRAKEQIALLADNLTKLNQIYSNMLSAMQGR